MLTGLQYRILKWVAPQERSGPDPYENNSKLAILLGPQFFDEIRGKTVIDFGCGEGAQAVEMAQKGADVIGLDLRESVLSKGRQRAAAAGVRCEFVTECTRPADIVVSIDAFEHFADPAGILEIMFKLLKPGGQLIASFGPTWYHPRGGHLVSVFPWAHLIFSEAALMRWRADIRSDGAKHHHEVEGGMNQMTIGRFEKIAHASPFEVVRIHPVPIRKLRPIHNGLTREWTTAVVQVRMRKPLDGR